MSTPARGHRGARSMRGSGRGIINTTVHSRGATRGSPNIAGRSKENGRGALSQPAGSSTPPNQGLLQKLRSGQLRRGSNDGANKSTRGASTTHRGASADRRGAGPTGPARTSTPPPRATGVSQPSTSSMTDTSARLQQLKNQREGERRDAIRHGIMADPEQKTTLEQAITPVGTCTDMCPAFERVERIVQLMVDKAEKTQDPASGRDMPSEPRMVKRFRRSAAGNDEQLPSDIRTPATLKKTLDHLIDNIVGGGERFATIHKFVWDRTRAIRNDFSIQQVSKVEDVKLAVECFERIARFHITALHQLSDPQNLLEGENFDAHQEREQLNNTLLSLMYYYDDNRHTVDLPNEGEFRAYCILFELQTQHPDLEDRMQTWPTNLLQDRRVRTAFDLYSAASNTLFDQGPLRPLVPSSIAQADGGRFWTILTSHKVSYMVACVAEIYFAHIRFTQLDAIWRSGKSAPAAHQQKFYDWTVSELTEYLAFDDDSQTIDFCSAFNLYFAERQGGEEYLDFTASSATSLDKSSIPSRQIFSHNVVEEKRFRRTTPAVINGLSASEATRQGLVEAPANTVDEEMPSQAEVDDDQSMFVPEQQKSSQGFSRAPFGSHLNPQATTFQPPTLAANNSISPTVVGKTPDATEPMATPKFGFGQPFRSKASTKPAFGTKFGQHSLASHSQTEPVQQQPQAASTSSTPSIFGKPFGTPSPVSTPFSGFGPTPPPAQAAPSEHTTGDGFAPPSQTPQLSSLFQQPLKPFGQPRNEPQEPISGPSVFSNPFAKLTPQSATTSPLSANPSSLFSTPKPSEHDKPPDAPKSQAFNFFDSATPQPSQAPNFNFQNAQFIPPFSSSELNSQSPPVPVTSNGAFSFNVPASQNSSEPNKSAAPQLPRFASTPSISFSPTPQTQQQSPAFLPPSNHKPHEISPIPVSTKPPEPQAPRSFNSGFDLFTSLEKQTSSSKTDADTRTPSIDLQNGDGSTKPPAAQSLLQSSSPYRYEPPKDIEQPSKTTPSLEDRSKITEKASRLALLQPNGLLETFTNKYIQTLVKKAYAQHKKEERQEIIAALFRSILRRKYGHLWVRLYWRKKLNKKAEARRRLIAETSKAEEERKQRSEKELEEILLAAAETKKIQAEVKKTAEREAQLAREQKQQQAQQKQQIVGRKRKSLSDANNAQAHPESPRKVLKAHSRSRKLGQSSDIAHRTSTTSSFGSSQSRHSVLGRSIGARSSNPMIPSEKLDKTETDYFKLMTFGVDPEVVGHTKRSLAVKARLEEEKRAEFISKSRIRPSMRSTPTSTPSPALKAVPTSASPPSSAFSRAPIHNIEPEEDEFLKELRQAREALSDDVDWFKSQKVVLEKEIEEVEQLRRSQSSNESPRVSINGLPMANGYEYQPAEVRSGHTMSRTEQRIRRTGAHGLAYKRIGGSSSYNPVAMSRKSALRYSSGSHDIGADEEHFNGLDGRNSQQHQLRVVADDVDGEHYGSHLSSRAKYGQQASIGNHIEKFQSANAFAALNSLEDEDQDEDLGQGQYYYEDGAEGDTEDMFEGDGNEEEEDDDEEDHSNDFNGLPKYLQGFDEDDDDEPDQYGGTQMSRSVSGAAASTAGASMEDAVVLSD